MSIFNPAIFNNLIFNTGESSEVVKTGTGGIDSSRKRKIIYKPTGLLAKRTTKEVIEERLEETRETHEEIREEIALSFREEKPIEKMTFAEVDQEIGRLLRKKLDQEDEEMMILMVMLND